MRNTFIHMNEANKQALLLIRFWKMKTGSLLTTIQNEQLSTMI